MSKSHVKKQKNSKPVRADRKGKDAMKDDICEEANGTPSAQWAGIAGEEMAILEPKDAEMVGPPMPKADFSKKTAHGKKTLSLKNGKHAIVIPAICPIIGQGAPLAV